MPNYVRIKRRGSGFEVEDQTGQVWQIPDDLSNRHRRMMQDDIDNNGAVIEDEFDTTEILANSKRAAKAATKAEAITRISAAVPALNSMDMVEFMVSLWPMLDTASAPAEITQARDIYQIAKTTIQTIDTLTQVELDAFDAETSPSWP